MKALRIIMKILGCTIVACMLSVGLDLQPIQGGLLGMGLWWFSLPCEL